MRATISGVRASWPLKWSLISTIRAILRVQTILSLALLKSRFAAKSDASTGFTWLARRNEFAGKVFAFWRSRLH